MIDKNIRIPEGTLIGPARRMMEKLNADCYNWDDYEYEQVKHGCGPTYATVPLANVRQQCEKLRKDGKLGVKKTNKARPKKQQPPADYLEYLKSEHWLKFRQTILEFWGYRCALCYSDAKMDVHHRVYRLYEEQVTDCLALCRRCHTAADRARQREARGE